MKHEVQARPGIAPYGAPRPEQPRSGDGVRTR